MISSVRPTVSARTGLTGYISAVSQKFTPCAARHVHLGMAVGFGILAAPGHRAQADRRYGKPGLPQSHLPHRALLFSSDLGAAPATRKARRGQAIQTEVQGLTRMCAGFRQFGATLRKDKEISMRASADAADTMGRPGLRQPPQAIPCSPRLRRWGSRLILAAIKISGQMPITRADLTLDFKDVSASRVAVTLDAAHADASFPFAAQAMKGPKVLDSKEFPQISFESTSVNSKGDGAEVDGPGHHSRRDQADGDAGDDLAAEGQRCGRSEPPDHPADRGGEPLGFRRGGLVGYGRRSGAAGYSGPHRTG